MKSIKVWEIFGRKFVILSKLCLKVFYLVLIYSPMNPLAAAVHKVARKKEDGRGWRECPRATGPAKLREVLREEAQRSLFVRIVQLLRLLRAGDARR